LRLGTLAPAARDWRVGKLAGTIVTEKIFSWPGLVRLTVDETSNRDYALVQGCLLSIGLTYVLVNLLTDVVYRWINPRIT
jgi:peptide/nickel transport system permease protein